MRGVMFEVNGLEPCPSIRKGLVARTHPASIINAHNLRTLLASIRFELCTRQTKKSAEFEKRSRAPQ